MKRGYRNLFIFEIIIFFALIVNSFIFSVLNNTIMIIFLFAILAIMKIFFGLERDRHRYTKDIILEEIIFLIIFFLIYYLSGILLGFAKVDNYYTIESMIKIILPIIIIILLKEYLRYEMLQKSEGNKTLIILTTILFVFLDISSAIYINLTSGIYEKFIFLAITILPTITINILCSYLSMETGYKPSMVYRLVTGLYMYLLPFIPNPNQYIYSIVWLFVPLLLMNRIDKFYQKYQDEDITKRDYKKNFKTLIIPSLVTIMLIYITCGYFKYFALAIASGSMSPDIKKGDIVIIEKQKDYEDIEVGKVIAYKYENVIVVHRLERKIKDENKVYFYTKGDANKDEDSYPVTSDMIIGVVNLRIPYIGLPTVWLNGK